MHFRSTVLVVVAVLGFWCAEAAAGTYTWKVATLAPKGIGWSKNLQKILVPAVREATGGDLEIQWYWGGLMGDDEDYIRKMRIDQLQGMACSVQGFIQAIPEMTVLCLPFLFQSWDEVDYLRQVMYPTFEAYAEKHGFRLLYWADQDFDQLYSTQWELNSLEEFRQAKFLAWLGPLESAVFNALGANAAPINVPEAAAAIRQGIVNAHICPSVWIVGAQVYMVYKYINPVKIRYSPAGLIVTKEVWEALPEAYRKNLMASRPAILEEFCRLTREDNQKAIDAMVKYGMHLVKPDPAGLAEIKEACRPVWYEQAGNLYPRELLDEVLSHLQAYRSRKGDGEGLPAAGAPR